MISVLLLLYWGFLLATLPLALISGKNAGNPKTRIDFTWPRAFWIAALVDAVAVLLLGEVFMLINIVLCAYMVNANTKWQRQHEKMAGLR